MKKILLTLAAAIMSTALPAAGDIVGTVTVTYSGTSATVDIPSSISSYVRCSSGTSSHVKLIQSSTSTNTPGEIMYSLTGSSTDGEFYLEGEYKTTVQLNGLTLTNPGGAAIHIRDGKRIKVSIASGTTNTLTDGEPATQADGTETPSTNGCLHSKGHTEFAGRGTLNITGKSRHGIYSKEYVEIKNCTINITTAVKDGIHCQQYFLMESGNVNISHAGDDGIQVELKGETPMAATDEEDEDTGNFYMKGGTLTISGTTAYAVKTDGIITYTGGLQEYDTANVLQQAKTDISGTIAEDAVPTGHEVVYDLNGRQMPSGAHLPKGIYILKKQGKTSKVLKK